MALPLIVCSSHSDPVQILSPCLAVLTLSTVDLLRVIEIVLELIQETWGKWLFVTQLEGDKLGYVFFLLNCCYKRLNFIEFVLLQVSTDRKDNIKMILS